MFIKVLIPVLFIVSILVLAPLFWIFYANDIQQNVTADGQYTGLLSFMNNINYLIAVVLSNIGYVLAVVLVVGVMVGAVVLVAAGKFLSG